MKLQDFKDIGFVVQMATLAGFIVATVSYCDASRNYSRTAQLSARQSLFQFEKEFLNQLVEIERIMVSISQAIENSDSGARDPYVRELEISIGQTDAMFVAMDQFALSVPQVSEAWIAARKSLCNILSEPEISYFTNSYTNTFLSSTRDICRE